MTPDPRLELVDRLFAGTGPTYDLVVTLCTAGIDKWWKRRILGRLPANPKRILDLAAGTGILTFAIARRFPQCQVIGVELRAEYLDIARARAAREGFANIAWVLSRAEDLELTEPVDAITSSYLAKYADWPRLVRKLNELLREDGVVITHEFTYPPNPVFAWAWEFYFKLLGPLGSRLLPQWRTIFYELPGLIRRTTWVQDSIRALRSEGFVDVKSELLTLGGAGTRHRQKASHAFSAGQLST